MSNNLKNMKTPKCVYLQQPTDFQNFQTTLSTLCEKWLTPGWDWTLKVGGKVQREIEERDPTWRGRDILKQYEQKEKDFLSTPVKKEFFPQSAKKGGAENKSPVPVSPPPPPPPLPSKGVLEVMGKRN